MKRLLVLILLFAAGCSFHEPTETDSLVKLPEAFSTSGEGPRPERWWTALRDAHLNALEEHALEQNLSLRATWDRLEQARTVVRSQGAAAWPTLEAALGARQDATRVREDSHESKREDQRLSGGLSASWEVDLWGRVRSIRRSAELDAMASDQDLRAAALSLTAEVASSWIRLVELRRQRELLGEQVETNADYLTTVTLRFRRGAVPAIDVLQQRQTLESVRGELSRLEASLAVEEHRLAVLLGEVPGQFALPDGTRLPSLPELPASGAPAAWLQRRPDLQAALLQLQAADHEVAVAVADRFPRVTLSAEASISFLAKESVTSWLFSLAANILAPIFDGGRRAAEVDRREALARERLHQYGDLLLRSLEEVENALVREARQRDYLRSLESQVDLSDRAVVQALDGYKKGALDFTRFLTTVLSQQRLARTIQQARRDQVLFRIALHRSLGGGFQLAPPPTEEP